MASTLETVSFPGVYHKNMLEMCIKSKIRSPLELAKVQFSSGEGNGTPLLASTLAWKIPWMEEPGRLAVHGVTTESDTTKRLHFHFHFSLSCIGEGNGNPLQCSCLKNPRDGEAWWDAIYGVAQSRTQLK